jgi:hypothetical protein
MSSTDDMKMYEHNEKFPGENHNRRSTDIVDPATGHNQDSMMIALEGLTKDVGWIKSGLLWAGGVVGGATVIIIGVVITYTVSVHSDIDLLQTKVAHYEEIAKQHHSSAGCHLVIPHSTPEVPH